MTDQLVSMPRVRVFWTPILDGPLADRAAATIEAILEALEHSPPEWKLDASVGHGTGALAVLHGYLDRAAPGRGHGERSAELLDRSIAAVAETHMSHDLFAGFTGIAWAVQHLQGDGTQDEEDVNEPIDEALESSLTNPTGSSHRLFDLIVGLVGIGVYALERMPRPSARRVLERIVHRLTQLSEETPQGITWGTGPELLPTRALERTPSGCYNLGVAHGVPGVIAFLGQACAAGVAMPEARRLLDGGIAWMLAQRLPVTESADFPSWIAPNGSPPAARVSWCYGNPGLAIALLVAARAVGETRWEDEAIAFAYKSVRRGSQDRGVVEACLCHGAAGNAHLFNRLFHATGDERFRDAARSWYERIFEFQQPGKGIAGFLSLGMRDDGEHQWVPSPGLLTGVTGIALALLAATTDVEPAWDRLLLAAIPPRG